MYVHTTVSYRHVWTKILIYAFPTKLTWGNKLFMFIIIKRLHVLFDVSILYGVIILRLWIM
jgi:hypothetical protein